MPTTAADASRPAGTLRRLAEEFPRQEFTTLVKRLPRYAKLAWALARDPSLSRVRRAAVMAAAAYVVSPIDLVPGFIPVAGQLDDVAVALAAIRLA
ncbi:MAG TPA: YkvA family protein, partial [Candidatus Limnocylindrales bacterium]|nr:YkvA family protein [Candidatus Limnocylindrales bacterium]